MAVWGFPVENHLWQKNKNWGYRNMPSREELNEGYLKLLEALRPLVADPGLNGAIYTQTTDVEGEVNGLMTYDRQVIKIDEKGAAAAAAKLYLPPPTVRTIVPTSDRAAQNWLTLLTPPGGKWPLPEFDDKAWSEAPGGFGAPDAAVGTVWNTPEIWARRRFTVGELDRENLWLRVRNSADVEVYLNGVLAAKLTGQSTDYQVTAINPRRTRCLRTGENVLSLHAKRNGGGQYVDAGLVEITEPLARDQ